MAHWLQKAHKYAGWIVVLGIAEIVLGFIVIAAPLAGGVAVTLQNRREGAGGCSPVVWSPCFWRS